MTVPEVMVVSAGASGSIISSTPMVAAPNQYKPLVSSPAGGQVRVLASTLTPHPMAPGPPFQVYEARVNVVLSGAVKVILPTGSAGSAARVKVTSPVAPGDRTGVVGCEKVIAARAGVAVAIRVAATTAAAVPAWARRRDGCADSRDRTGKDEAVIMGTFLDEEDHGHTEAPHVP
ncbi:hypothetical protein [Micromonospora sp. NPDC023956]|uniref:hypothetical protein n=1 Tax=Micromonospora sp. NPDC023956 TaxID=3155722 RepID=UPI0033F9077F